jgi:antitoxin CptB
MADNTDMTEQEIRYRRLKFRSWHRGIKEMDLILGHFADTCIEALSPTELDEYETLIEIDDRSLYNWIIGHEPTPTEFDTRLFARIQTFNHLEGTLWPRKG